MLKRFKHIWETVKFEWCKAISNKSIKSWHNVSIILYLYTNTWEEEIIISSTSSWLFYWELQIEMCFQRIRQLFTLDVVCTILNEHCLWKVLSSTSNHAHNKYIPGWRHEILCVSVYDKCQDIWLLCVYAAYAILIISSCYCWIYRLQRASEAYGHHLQMLCISNVPTHSHTVRNRASS